MTIARRHKLVVIEDAAQAPGAVYKGRLVGGITHMTVFSLNCHKHIHTGEGGVVTTNDGAFAEKLQLIRNHGESVVEEKGTRDLVNSFGFNLRYTEMHAAVAIEQLKKLPWLLDWRIRNADYLNKRLGQFPGIRPGIVRPGCRHVYYVQPFLYDSSIIGIDRDTFITAVSAELPTSPDRDGGSLIWCGYGKPLYLLPLYQNKIAYAGGFPFKRKGDASRGYYKKGICPVVERIETKELFMNDFIRPPAAEKDMADVVSAFEKVYNKRAELVRARKR